MKKRLLLLLTLAILSCKNTPEPLDKDSDFDLAITNIGIIDLEKGDLLQNKTVFIKNDLISAISDSQSNTSTATQVIDGTGKFLLPGFWDNHVHFRGGDSLISANKNFLVLFLANGITTLRECGGDMTSTILDWQQKIANKQLAGPTIYTSGPKLDGKNARWEGSLEIASEEDIAPALDSLQLLETDFVKLYDSKFTGELYLKTIKAAEKRKLISSGHMPFSVTLEETTAAGMDGIEHLYYVLKACSAEEDAITKDIIAGKTSFWASLDRVMHTYNKESAKTAFATLKSRDVYVIPTLHINHTLSYLDEENHDKDEYLYYMGDGITKTYEGRIKSALNASDAVVKTRKQLDSAFVSLVKNLQDNKVKLLAGSDCGAFNSYVYPGISLHQELKALVKAGLSPLQALQTSALNGAKFLKKENIGSIKENYKADLVILNANPLENIDETKNINLVIKNGKVFKSLEQLKTTP